MRRILSYCGFLFSFAVLFSCSGEKKIAALQTCAPDIQTAVVYDDRFTLDTVEVNKTMQARLQAQQEEKAFNDSLAKEVKDSSYVEQQQQNNSSSSIFFKDESGEIQEKIVAARLVVRRALRQERGGKVDLDFDVYIPRSVFDQEWKIELVPEILLLNKVVSEIPEENHREVLPNGHYNLDKIIINGKEFRNQQLKGYERYNKFISSIVTDTTRFQDQWQLEAFLKRNLPGIYKFKNDSSIVSESAFLSAYGVNEQQAVEHYTRSWERTFNRWKGDRSQKMFDTYVKSPIDTNGVHLDTVISAFSDSLLVYRYHTTISTKGRPTLNHALVYVDGAVYQYGENKIYTIPKTDSLDFPISTIMDFVRDTVMHKIGHRETHPVKNEEYNIAFAIGKDNVNRKLGNNETEIALIQKKIRELIRNNMYTLDSIIVTAAASPEGTWSANASLANRRANSMISFIQPFGKDIRDSLVRVRRDSLRRVHQDDWEGADNLIGEFTEEEKEYIKKKRKEAEDDEKRLITDIPRITFTSHSDPVFWRQFNPEYWEKLEKLVEEDTVGFTAEQREEFAKLATIRNDDAREAAMRQKPWYKYMRETLYPYLRVVRFDFLLHLKSTIQETYVMDEIDDVYMSALECCKNRDFEEAYKIFTSTPLYEHDYNMGVAYLMMDRNKNAIKVLEMQERTSDVNYMLALAYTREGRDDEGVAAFNLSVKQDESKFIRGRKDPEIIYLIGKYELRSPAVIRAEQEQLKKEAEEREAKRLRDLDEERKVYDGMTRAEWLEANGFN